jgi:hypothetical protein
MSELLPYHTTDTTARFELEHGWQFLPDPTGRIRFADLAVQTTWREARAGLSWNVQFDDLRNYMGAAWYRIEVDIPAFREMRHVLLKFGAVDYFCEVFVNGVSVGNHEGGYTPFSFDITHAVHPGRNEIAVRVIDPPMNEAENRALFPEMMYNEIPHGKQNWYVQNSGIWQGVRLELCPSIYIDRVDVTSRNDGSFQAQVRLAGMGITRMDGSESDTTMLELVVYDAAGRRVSSHSRPVGAWHTCELQGKISNPRLWSPQDPHLYYIDASLSGAVQYRRRVRFGFRSFEARDGKFFLNGERFYMIGALDQDFYPETIHTPSSEQFVRTTMLEAQRLGINVLRCHLKIAHPVYLDVADEIGMLVWTEMPSWSDSWFPCDHFSTRAALRAEKMIEEVTLRDGNHPCIIIRTIINESWGINLKQEEQRRWLRDAFERVKNTLRPLGWLVVDNSACEGNFHVKTDIEDFHNYYSMPDQVDLWDKWVDELASRPSWTFSPYGDAERSGEEPLLVSEFGNWGLPLLPENEELPWWFHYSFGGREVTSPSGVFHRLRDFQFSPLFKDYSDFAIESQWHQYISLKYEIESMRMASPIQGYVVTAMTDVHWEVNGLLDMWRRPKVFSEQLASLQQPDVVLARARQWTAFPGNVLEADLYFSHFSDVDLAGARLRWSTDSGAGGAFSLQRAERGTVIHMGRVNWATPPSDVSTIERMYIEVRSGSGLSLAENTSDFFVVPKAGMAPPFCVHDPQRMLQHLTSASDEGASVIVSNVLDDRVLTHLSSGGTAVVLVDSTDALPPSLPIIAKVRARCELDGRWFSNYNWVRTDRPPFSTLNFGRILGFESAKVVPAYVLQGIDPGQFGDVLAAATFGWLQKNSALVVQMRVGEGRLILTTFRFNNYVTDAYATALLHAFVRYVSSRDCQPKLELTRTEQAQAR